MVVYLLSRHIRNGGDDTRCVCPYCYIELTLREESYAEWMKCPRCNMTGHSACIRRGVLASNDTFLCPNCRSPFDKEYMLSDPSAWSAIELQPNMRENSTDREYIGKESKRSSERKLRSSGPVQETLSLRNRIVSIK